MDKDERRELELIKAGLLSATFKAARIVEAHGFVSQAEFKRLYAVSTKAKETECYAQDLTYKQRGSFGSYIVKAHVSIYTYRCSFLISNAPGTYKQGTLVTSNHEVEQG